MDPGGPTAEAPRGSSRPGPLGKGGCEDRAYPDRPSASQAMGGRGALCLFTPGAWDSNTAHPPCALFPNYRPAGVGRAHHAPTLTPPVSLPEARASRLGSLGGRGEEREGAWQRGRSPP